MKIALDFKPRILHTIKGYSWKAFGQDAMAGTIVGIVALPLAIAFGIASGVSPEVGIFTAVLGGLIVSLLGGSNVQIGGPTGAFIVVIYGIIQRFGIDGLIIATLMAGILLLAMGLLRLGTLIRYIPYPIVVGFTAGIALTIFSTQINDLFGLGLSNLPGDFVGKWRVYAEAASQANWIPLLFAISSILLILFTPRFSQRVPGSLVAIVLLSLAAYGLKNWFGLNAFECIGDRYTIAGGLPSIQIPTVTLETIRELFPSAFTIALLGAIESLLSASVADGVTGDRHHSNTELIAQGVANLAVPLFGGIPVTGAIARTMTNINNNGRTPIAGLVHAAVLLLLLLFLGPLMDYIPMAVLAGVLVMVAYNMSGWRSVVGILRGPKGDAIVMTVTFVLTVLIDLTVAIEVGLLLAIFLFMRRMVGATHIRVTSGVLRFDQDERPLGSDELIAIPDGVEIYEIEGPYFFGIANRFEETVTTLGKQPKVRIIRLRLVPFMDSTAVYNLSNLARMSQRSKVHLILSGVNDSVRETLHSTGLSKTIGVENICKNIHDAIKRSKEIMQPNNAQ